MSFTTQLQFIWEVLSHNRVSFYMHRFRLVSYNNIIYIILTIACDVLRPNTSPLT